MALSASLYELISLAARYWFVALVVVIVLVSFTWMWQDRLADHRRRAELPDAGMIGYFEVLQGGEGLAEGTMIPIPREGILGYIRGCDVCIPVSGIRSIHADYEFLEGKGIYLLPRKGCTLAVNGVILTHRSDPRANPLHHHQVLTLGDAVLRLLLFAGIDEPTDPGLQPAALPEQPPVPAGEALPLFDPTDPSAPGYPLDWQPTMPADSGEYPPEVVPDPMGEEGHGAEWGYMPVDPAMPVGDDPALLSPSADSTAEGGNSHGT